MYKYADVVIEALDKYLLDRFGKLKSKAAFDEVNRLRAQIEDLFLRLEQEIRKLYLWEAQRVYKDTAKQKTRKLDEQWLDDMILESYDPVSKVVFNHELDRRKAELLEAVIASNTPTKEIDAQTKRMALLLRSYAIRVTDEAVLQVFRDEGWKRVKWVTMRDEYACKACLSRNGRVYNINRLPPKPHFNCRCRYLRAL